MQYWYTLFTKSECKDLNEFLQEKNFTWKVISQPCFSEINEKRINIEKYKANFRNDNFKFLGLSTKSMIQNDECFKYADNFKKDFKDSYFCYCGDSPDKRHSYLTMFLKEEIICDEKYNIYISWMNNFEGLGGQKFVITPIRQKDNSVIQIADIKHKRIMPLKTYEDEQKAVNIYLDYIKNKCTIMKNKKINLNEIVNLIFEDKINKKEKKFMNLRNANIKEYFREIFIKNNGDSIYDLYMAMSSFFCNVKSNRMSKEKEDLIRYFNMVIKIHYELESFYKNFLK